MSKLKDTNEKIAKGVAQGYKRIENGVVTGYKKIEDGVVGGFDKVSDKCVKKLFAKEGETVAEAKKHLANKKYQHRTLKEKPSCTRTIRNLLCKKSAPNIPRLNAPNWIS